MPVPMRAHLCGVTIQTGSFHTTASSAAQFARIYTAFRALSSIPLYAPSVTSRWVNVALLKPTFYALAYLFLTTYQTSGSRRCERHKGFNISVHLSQGGQGSAAPALAQRWVEKLSNIHRGTNIVIKYRFSGQADL